MFENELKGWMQIKGIGINEWMKEWMQMNKKMNANEWKWIKGWMQMIGNE